MSTRSMPWEITAVRA